MTPADGIRARNRAAIETEILDVARTHLATHGAAALSLRAIARDVGMVSSALYRYVASRDDLLTLLIIRAYTELADAAQSAHDAVPLDDLVGRHTAICRAVRCWAVANPHDWALLYGSPVPDYDAPGDRTGEPGTRVVLLLSALLAEAGRVGALSERATDTGVEAVARAEQAVGPLLLDPALAGLELSATTLLTGIQSWTLLVGIVSAEVFEQFGSELAWDAVFESTVQTMGDLVLGPSDGG